MSWKTILKLEKYITWMSSDKKMGWIDGHLATDVQIRAYMRKHPEYTFNESISTTSKKPKIEEDEYDEPEHLTAEDHQQLNDGPIERDEYRD